MQRLFFIAATGLGLVAAACQEKDAVAPQDTTGLVGEWAWVSSSGGIAGATYTPATTGTIVKWVFRADSTVHVYSTKQGAAQPVQAGTYSLGTASSNGGTCSLTLRLAISQVYLLQELGSRLVVTDNYADGFSSTYQRQ